MSITCSYINILKQKLLSEVGRECKLCLNAILENMNLMIFVIQSNKNHIALILFNQAQNIFSTFLT